MVICDGLGDRANRALRFKTPLQAASTPNMDKLVSRGSAGIMDVISPGIPPGSDTAHLALLGYDPMKYYSGRGPFEALGIGMKVDPGDVALRLNFSTMEKGVITDRRAGRIKDVTQLCEAIDGMKFGDVTVNVQPGTEHRGVAVLRGPDLSSSITDVDPHDTGMKFLKCKHITKEGEKTANIVNMFVKKANMALADHPLNNVRKVTGKKQANAVLPRGAGIMREIPSLKELFDIKAAAVSGISLVKGVCRAAGMNVRIAKGLTGGIDTDLDKKVNLALSSLKTHDLVLMNIKFPDIYGHDGDPKGKKEGVERIDKALAPFLDLDRTVVAVTADHSTPCTVMNHSGDPVPLLITSPDGRRDDIKTFDEIQCAKGAIQSIRGRNLLPLLLDRANKVEKFGA